MMRSLRSLLDFNLSDHTMAMGSTQPLSEMSKRDLPWGAKAAGAYD